MALKEIVDNLNTLTWPGAFALVGALVAIAWFLKS
jgi:hypothetical protein